MLTTTHPTRAGAPRERRPARDEAGFTFVELSMVLLITTIVLTMMIAMITVYAKAEATTSNSANAASAVRLALLQLQSDIQSANPVGTLASVSAYNDELQVTVQPSGKVITWQYTYATQKLTRQIGSSPAMAVLTNVTNGNPSSGGIPVFVYLDHCSANLVTQPQATPASISGATTEVEVVLSVANLNSAPYGSTTATHVMSQPPGTNLCG